jgi:hypothetical protein
LRKPISAFKGCVGSVGFAEQTEPFVGALFHRALSRFPEQLDEAALGPLLGQLIWVAAVGRSALAVVAEEQTQQPTARPEQPPHRVAVSLALAGVDGTETGVLEYAIEAARFEPCSGQGFSIKQVSLQPAQLGPRGTVPLACSRDRLGAEVEPGHGKAEIGQQGRLVAAAAARNQHRCRRFGSQGVMAQEPLQGRRRLAQFPGIGAIAIALVPEGCRA